MSKIFTCTNGRLMCFLKFYGFSWLESGFDKTNSKFWTFADDDDFQKAMQLFRHLLDTIPPIDNKNKIHKYEQEKKENEYQQENRKTD